jgi:two-component system, LytTR family, response regulator LytT
MRILILEDEEQAAKRLQKIVKEILPSATIVEVLATIEKSVEWLRQNSMPDLIFQDIQLADGNSFSIFNLIEVTCPIIFTTAYENYAIKAFKVNSIDYLLKPLDKADVIRSLEKLQKLQKTNAPVIDYQAVLKPIAEPRNYRQRFVIKLGDMLKSLNTDEIAYFYTENRSNFVCTNNGKRYPVDYNLDQVERMLNPKKFFRINRQFVIGHHAIQDMKAHTRLRVIVTLTPPSKLDTIVALDRAQDFRNWLADE